MASTGVAPISVRWVVHNKEDKQHPNVRAILVARHIREKYGCKDGDDLVAAMPLFEVVKLFPTRCVQKRENGIRMKWWFIDTSKAHLYAPVDEWGRGICSVAV